MKIALMGDVMLGRLVNNVLKELPASYPWGNTLPILQECDLRLCNLECVLSDVGVPWSATPKAFHFRSDEKNVEVLTSAGIQMVSIANNHVLDFEEEALFRMLEVLDQNHILHAGAGRNLEEAKKPAVLEVKGEKVGLIAFTDNEPDWEAGLSTPGVYFVPTEIQDSRAQDLFQLIQALRPKVDFLIVSAHWGGNWGYRPPKEHITFAHALIDAGADLVFGHSPHIFRGIEIYKDRPILYSAGDFIDDYAVDEVEKNDESFLFVLDKGKKLLLTPTCIEQFQGVLAPEWRKNSILVKMEGLCSEFGTSLENFTIIIPKKFLEK